MNCKNCHTELQAQDDYCKSCGGKVIRNRLSPKNLFAHFSETFLNYDNKFLKTFISLWTKPEIVVRSYISGTRKKYVNVISYFAIAVTLSGIQMFLLQKFFPDAFDVSAISQKGTEAFNKGIFDFVQEYQSIAMMLNVPFYALISWLVFIKEKKYRYNYTEHLVIFMYILAQMSILNVFLILIGASFGLSIGVLSMVFGPIQIIYSGYCLKRIFDLDWSNFILRTLIFFGVLIVLAVIFTAIFSVFAIKSGMFDEMIKAKRAAIEAQKIIKDSIN